MARTLVFADFRSALKFLRGRVSDRKFRLLAVAACRHTYPAAGLTPEWEAAVAVVERFAEAEADGQELAREQAASLARACFPESPPLLVGAWVTLLGRNGRCRPVRVLEVGDKVV